MSKLTQSLAFASTGADLRTHAAAGCEVAKAEIARRAAKAPTSVAQLRSRGMAAEADARIAKPKAKSEKPKAAAFTRATPVAEVAAAPKAKRDTVSALRVDLTALAVVVRTNTQTTAKVLEIVQSLANRA